MGRLMSAPMGRYEAGGTCTLCGREVAVDVTIEWSKALGLRHLAGSPLCGVTVQEGRDA